MSQPDGKIIGFRHIKGRIIPIRAKGAEAAKTLGKGAAVAGAGVAVSVGAGIAEAELALRAQKLHAFGKSAAKHADDAWKAAKGNRGFQAARRGEAAFERATRAAGLSSKIGAAGQALGAAGIAAGVNEALKHTKLKDDPEVRASIAAGSGVAAQFAIRHAFEARFFRDATASQAIRRAITTAAKKALRIL